MSSPLLRIAATFSKMMNLGDTKRMTRMRSKNNPDWEVSVMPSPLPQFEIDWQGNPAVITEAEYGSGL